MVKSKEKLSLEESKKKIDSMISSFTEHFIEKRYDKYGNEEKIVNPMAIKSYFFSTQEIDKSTQPIYTLEQINFFYNIFIYTIEQINLYIYPFAADVKDFCKMINISNEELMNYKNNNSNEMKNIIEKLYDFCRDSNITLAQNKIFNSNITSLKAKSELGMIEKKEPTTKINIQAKVPLEVINERLAVIRNYEKKAVIESNE